MVTMSQALPDRYWQEISINKQDLELIHNHLFENETPLSVGEIVRVFVEGRIQAERTALAKKRKSAGRIFIPKERFKRGEKVTFPHLDWAAGEVLAIRPGNNPQHGDFDVIEVLLDSGDRHMFAARLEQHSLNDAGAQTAEGESDDVDTILANHGQGIESALISAFQTDQGLVRIAGRWFPKALLVDVNQGHLNLAEAVLDLAGGEPLPTQRLLADVELPDGINLKLAEFSLNLALQEDDRFDEVGPAGEVLWCLKRLEPQAVREVPLTLKYDRLPYDRTHLTAEMVALEAQLDDEYSESSRDPAYEVEEATISLIYPHWRAGTLPITPRLQTMFPTAYESPRVRFTLVDGDGGERYPAWVVRQHRYVSGLREWYEARELMPGSLIRIRRGAAPGEVVIVAQTHRTTKDWVRTAIVGADGGIVFALLKQTITAEINDRMAFAIPTLDALDRLWEQPHKKGPKIEALVPNVMRELTKLNPQGHVHAQELYSAINIVRRVPPGPLLALLASAPETYIHVGDLHYRLAEKARED